MCMCVSKSTFGGAMSLWEAKDPWPLSRWPSLPVVLCRETALIQRAGVRQQGGGVAFFLEIPFPS